ncbi:MAG: hypothetical protein KA914_02360 [Ottowia sp.]|nr:hypothetical protein [Ottowia sp.]
MRTIEIFRLRRVRDKPRALAVMQALAEIDAPAARLALNQAIGGGKPALHLPDDTTAHACIAALAGAGFVARFASAADFDAQARAEAAVLAAVDHLPRAISDGAGALLLAGDWQGALAMCLQAAQESGERCMSVHPVHPVQLVHPVHRLLSTAALEVGLQPGQQGNG